MDCCPPLASVQKCLLVTGHATWIVIEASLQAALSIIQTTTIRSAWPCRNPKKAAPHELSIAWLKSSTHLKHYHEMDAAIHSNLFTCSSMHSLTCRLRRSAVPLQKTRMQTQISISCLNVSLRRDSPICPLLCWTGCRR